MKMQAIRNLAKQFGIDGARKGREELIRAIQRAEGNFDCFGSDKDYCDQYECRFCEMCLK